MNNKGWRVRVKRMAGAHPVRNRRKPGNAFEVLLEKWQQGDEVSWGELFAAWLKTPLAPRTPDMVRKVIRKVEWIT